MLSCSFRTRCLMPLDHCTAILLVTFILPAWLGCWATKESLWSLKNFLKSSKVWYVKIFIPLPIDQRKFAFRCFIGCYYISYPDVLFRRARGSGYEVIRRSLCVSHDACRECLFKNQDILSLLIISVFLITCMFDQEVILKGEFRW